MPAGMLEVAGSIDVNQFWPTGRSDADTTKVIVKVGGGAIQFRKDSSSPFQVTHVFDNATVKGRTTKPPIKNGQLTIRLQGIDATELHYQPSPLSSTEKKGLSKAKLAAYHERALELIDAVGLSDFAGTQAGELAYGRKRALEIATTLALDPEMMLLDEPTAGMTHEDVERITELIRKVAVNRTVLMVEHNLSVVSTLSDHITVLARGEVLAEGDYANVSRHPAVVEAYMGTAVA